MLKRTGLIFLTAALVTGGFFSAKADETCTDPSHKHLSKQEHAKKHMDAAKNQDHDHGHSHDHVSFGFKPMGNLLTVTEKGKTRNLTDNEVRTIVAEKMKPYFEHGMMHRIKDGKIRVQKETVSFDVVDLSGAPVQTLTFDRKTGVSLEEMEIYKVMEKHEKRMLKAKAEEQKALERQKKAVERKKPASKK